MARDFDSSKYQQIASEIAELIESGELGPDDKLATRPELEQRYAVSRQVVQNALNLLHHEGYLSSQSSRGTFVKRPPRLTLPMYAFEQEERHVDAFIAIVEQAGHRGRQDIRVETIRPSAAIADQLAIPAGRLALVRRRVRYVDDVPYALADSYFPNDLVEGSRIADPEDITEGGRHILVKLGIGMASHRDAIIARRPSHAEVQLLDIAPGCAVIAHNRLSCTVTGQPIRLLATVLPSDRWEITYDGLGS
jgi:GntR family transcriptional regulator